MARLSQSNTVLGQSIPRQQMQRGKNQLLVLKENQSGWRSRWSQRKRGEHMWGQGQILKDLISQNEEVGFYSTDSGKPLESCKEGRASSEMYVKYGCNKKSKFGGYLRVQVSKSLYSSNIPCTDIPFHSLIFRALRLGHHIHFFTHKCLHTKSSSLSSCYLTDILTVDSIIFFYLTTLSSHLMVLEIALNLSGVLISHLPQEDKRDYWTHLGRSAKTYNCCWWVNECELETAAQWKNEEATEEIDALIFLPWNITYIT